MQSRAHQFSATPSAPLEFTQEQAGEPAERHTRGAGYRVMVCVRGDTHAAGAILAAASLSQELGADWYAVSVVPRSRRPVTWFRRWNRSAAPLNARLAETLGATVVTVRADDPAQGAVAFARREGITHAIFGHAQPGAIMSLGSMVRTFSHAVRGVEVRVVALDDRAAPMPLTRIRARLHGTLLPAAGLLAVMVMTAVIAFVPWPLMFLFVVIAAAIWCWRLERSREM